MEAENISPRVYVNKLSKMKSNLVQLCKNFYSLATSSVWRGLLNTRPLWKTVNIICCHYACNGNKQITCSTVTELV